jgi:hypothetical protein
MQQEQPSNPKWLEWVIHTLGIAVVDFCALFILSLFFAYCPPCLHSRTKTSDAFRPPPSCVPDQVDFASSPVHAYLAEIERISWSQGHAEQNIEAINKFRV